MGHSANRQFLKLVCLLSTSAYSALEILHIMLYINLLTYLHGLVVGLTYKSSLLC